MVLSVNRKIRSMSMHGYSDKSEILNDSNLPIYWDEVRSVNYALLSHISQGDIISAVVTFNEDAEDTVIDGVFNRVGNKIEFLAENDISGNKIEVKYLV